ncbi:MAG: Ku protein [Methanocellales archaeon]
MRAIWSGTISFGLVNIPVKLYVATESKDVAFTSLHSICGTPLKRPYWCTRCGREVPYNEIDKGYEYVKDRYVVLSEGDFEKLPIETSRRLEIINFAAASEIDPIYYETNYYLGPDGNDAKAFELFREVLSKKNKVAIAKITFRRKEHIAAIRPGENHLIMSTLFYAHEIRDPKLIAYPKPEISDMELELAEVLIERLSGSFEPEKYRERYREALLELIKAKIEGKEVKVILPEAKPTVDLMTALKASVEALKSKA